ncbi:MAG: hypothetical protein ACHQQS_11535 [Thermoanaerobaculales bacterium]
MEKDESPNQNKSKPEDRAISDLPHVESKEDQPETSRKRHRLSYHLRPTTSEKWMLAVQAIGVAAVIVYAYYAREQARAMREAVREATRSNGLIAEQLKLVNANLDATQRQLGLSAQQLDEFRKQSDLVQAQTDIARQSLELANRAWITVRSITAEKDIFARHNLLVYIDNTGHRPARGVIMAQAVVDIKEPTFKEDIHESPQDVPVGYGMSRYVIGPGHPYEITVAMPELRPEDIATLWGPPGVDLYLLGRTEYEDGFGRTRHTDFCSIWRRMTLTWEQCRSGNSAD